MLNEGIELLFLNPVDWEMVIPALEACQEAGVPVINVDTVVKDTRYVVSIIETDNYQAGVECAKDLMKRLPRAEIVIMNSPIQQSITQRIQGFKDTITRNENYQVVQEESGAGEIEGSAEVMGSLLKENIEFDVVIGGNDPTAFGVFSALIFITNDVLSAISHVKKLLLLNQGYKATQEDFNQGKVAFMPLAWEFLKTLTFDEEIQRDIFQDSQGVSVLKSVTQSDEAENIIKKNMEENEQVIDTNLLGEIIEKGVIAPKTQEYEQAVRLMDGEISNIIEENKNIESVVKIFQRNIESVYFLEKME